MSRPSHVAARPAACSALALLAMMCLLSCNGCPSGPSAAARGALPHDASASSADDDIITEDEYEILPIGHRMYLPDGSRDFANQYSFTVMISATVEGHGVIMCSGALISPQVAVTAGHCVCVEHAPAPQGGQAPAVIDGTWCATHATVETVTYTAKRLESRLLWDEHYRSSSGKVRTHPDLEIRLSARGAPISLKADLAIIILDDPISGTSPMAHLPTSEVRADETFTIVGYGLDGKTDLIKGLRRFGRKKTLSGPRSGDRAILFEQVGAAFSSGSGDSCLRQSHRGPELIGITSLVLEEGFAFTDLYSYRDWLLSEIQRASLQAQRTQKTQEGSP